MAFVSASGIFRPWRKRALVAATIVPALLALAAVVLALRWPFTEDRILESIRDSWPGPVRVEMFRASYFPPGCTMEHLVLELPSNRSTEPARIDFAKARIQASYADLFLRPGHLARLAAEGVRAEIPVYSSASAAAEGRRREGADKSSNSGRVPIETTFGEVDASNATLEVKRSDGKTPLPFQIHHLILRPVRGTAPVFYDATLTNAEPPGEVHVHGQFGPWEPFKQLGDLPISGAYSFDRANLGVFSGIAGILSSTGNFGGTLGQMKVEGAVNIPDFQVTRSRHEVALGAKFRSVVDATRGNVTLNDVEAYFRRTNVHAEGKVAPEDERAGKSVSVNLTVRNGRIEDVLDLFVTDRVAPMTGAADFQARVVIPPGDKPFLKKLNMAGNFSIADAVLTNPGRQDQVDAMSKRASGKAKDPETERISGRIEGSFLTHEGVARFDPVSFKIPGANIAMTGEFNLLNENLHFHGDAKTSAELSDQAKGVKSALLKPLNRLFKKKDAGADVPVEMTGTYDRPHFGLDLTGKK
jgi:AsmA-like C-terminal region